MPTPKNNPGIPVHKLIATGVPVKSIKASKGINPSTIPGVKKSS